MKNELTSSTHSGGRDAVFLLAGIAGGILGSRLLPPLIAQATSAARAKSGADPFQLLIEDHREILAVLDRMAGAPSASAAQRGKLFLALKRRLAKHAMAEEDVVYPIVSKEPGTGTQGQHLYHEHADMKILLYELESQLMAGQDWSAAVGRLRDLIRSHIDEEEETVFPALRSKLEESAKPRVSGQISREEALVL